MHDVGQSFSMAKIMHWKRVDSSPTYESYFRTPFGEYLLKQDTIPHVTTDICNMCLQGAPTTKAQNTPKSQRWSTHYSRRRNGREWDHLALA